jgi:hypothetical protein
MTWLKGSKWKHFYATFGERSRQELLIRNFGKNRLIDATF